MIRMLKPARLRKGDVIGLISPAGPLMEITRLEKGVRYLESLGYRVKVGKHAANRNGYLAGTDRERLADLHGMFSSRRVKAIIAVRGGYGTPRLLPFINYDLIRKNPKILVGFSDLTALQIAIWTRTGLVTFHGPMLGPDMGGRIDPFTEEMFWRSVTACDRTREVKLGEAQVLFRGTGTGRLIGGNLSLLISLLGTEFQPRLRKALLFVEEVGEEPYRVDRMLTHLRNSGALKGISGILAGMFTGCLPTNRSAHSPGVDGLLAELARQSRVPFLSNLPFGHEKRKLTLPVGIRAAVKASVPSIEFLESPVS